MKVAFHPSLYDPYADTPTLHGVRCRSCLTAFFPPFGVGCEVCGAPGEALERALLAAAGIIYSTAVVHHHPGTDIATPFTMAEIQLDAGPLIRATLTGPVPADAIGARVEGRWIPAGADENGDEVTELRFALTTT